LKLEPDLDPEPEKLSEHGASVIGQVNFRAQIKLYLKLWSLYI